MMQPAKFLRKPPIRTFLVHGSLNTSPMFLKNAIKPFSSFIPAASLSAFSYAATAFF